MVPLQGVWQGVQTPDEHQKTSQEAYRCDLYLCSAEELPDIHRGVTSGFACAAIIQDDFYGCHVTFLPLALCFYDGGLACVHTIVGYVRG